MHSIFIFCMDSLGLFGIIGGASTTAKIVKAGDGSILNNTTMTVAINVSWDYGVITGGGCNSGASYTLLFPVFFAPGMSAVYGSCFFSTGAEKREVKRHAMLTNITASSFIINEYSTVSYILISLS